MPQTENLPTENLTGEMLTKIQPSVMALDLEIGFSGDPARAQQRFARQLAMYMAHTAFGLKQSHTARLFERHHSTAQHAMSVTEDLRADPVFNQKLERVEQFLGEFAMSDKSVLEQMASQNAQLFLGARTCAAHRNGDRRRRPVFLHRARAGGAFA